MFNFLRHQTISHSGCTIVHSQQQCIKVLILCILTNACHFLFLYYGHPSGFEVASHCAFDLHLPNDAIFSSDFWSLLYILLEKCLFVYLAHFKLASLFVVEL